MPRWLTSVFLVSLISCLPGCIGCFFSIDGPAKSRGGHAVTFEDIDDNDYGIQAVVHRSGDMSVIVDYALKADNVPAERPNGMRAVRASIAGGDGLELVGSRCTLRFDFRREGRKIVVMRFASAGPPFTIGVDKEVRFVNSGLRSVTTFEGGVVYLDRDSSRDGGLVVAEGDWSTLTVGGLKEFRIDNLVYAIMP